MWLSARFVPRSASSATISGAIARRHESARRSSHSLATLVTCLAASVAVVAVAAFAGTIVIDGRTPLTGGLEGPEGCAILATLAAGPFVFVADRSTNQQSTVWKLDATTNALVSTMRLQILAVSGRSCFVRLTSGYFASRTGATNWITVSLDVMMETATTGIDSDWRSCSLEPTAVHAYCTRDVSPMVIAKLNCASPVTQIGDASVSVPVTKVADVTVARATGASWYADIDSTFFFTTAREGTFHFVRLNHTAAVFDVGALATLETDAGDGNGRGVVLNSATAATVAYVTTNTRFLRIACATTPMTRIGGVANPGTSSLYCAVVDSGTASVYVSSESGPASVYRYDVATDAFITADTVTLNANEQHPTLVIPFPGKLLAATFGSARSLVNMTIPPVTSTTTSSTTARVAGAITLDGRTPLLGGVNGPEGGAMLATLAGVRYLIVVDRSDGLPSTLWKFDTTTNALVGTTPLSIFGVNAHTLFEFNASGFFGAYWGTNNNWQVVALDTMEAGATSSIDSLRRGCSLEPSAVHAYCTRKGGSMVIAKMLRASPISKVSAPLALPSAILLPTRCAQCAQHEWLLTLPWCVLSASDSRCTRSLRDPLREPQKPSSSS
jgi:hypothetical protein